MAIKSLVQDGYGQVELNHVAFRRDGRIEAQCALPEGVEYLENGELVLVDTSKMEVALNSHELAGFEAKLPIAFHYSAERLPDERKSGLKHFRLEKTGPLPRLGYLTVGDTITMNNIVYDEEEFADLAAIKTAADANELQAVFYTGLTAELSEAWSKLRLVKKTHTAPADATLRANFNVAKLTTMPDGQPAVELHVIYCS